jgi:hypothetical protein
MGRTPVSRPARRSTSTSSDVPRPNASSHAEIQPGRSHDERRRDQRVRPNRRRRSRCPRVSPPHGNPGVRRHIGPRPRLPRRRPLGRATRSLFSIRAAGSNSEKASADRCVATRSQPGLLIPALPLSSLLYRRPRPIKRVTGNPRRRTAPGRGVSPMTRPRIEFRERTRRMRPTEQFLARIRCRACPSVLPITLGTTQRCTGRGSGCDGAVVPRRR